MTHPRANLASFFRRSTLLASLGLVAALFPANLAAAQPPTPEDADQVIVRYRAGTTETERAGVAHAYGLTKVHGSANGRTEVFVDHGRSQLTALRLLSNDPNVAAVSPNSWRELSDEITDEPDFGDLWGLDNIGQVVGTTAGTPDVDIDGLEALRIVRGNPNVVVAVIDSGVDFTHPDLAAAAWDNPGESGVVDGIDRSTNGLDDDHNGYVDDVHGWDFCDNDASVGPAPGISNAHGTHVAGTIGASLNGTGIVGVAAGVKIMSLRAFAGTSACGSGDLGLIAAIDYAASFNVPVINASWGGPSASAPLDASIQDAQHSLLIAAAGNGDRTTGLGINIDQPGGVRFYPANSALPNVLTVAAITQSGSLASFSNYGTTSVDLAAPGTNIVSTLPGGQYGIASGTSMAAPHVSGVAALAISAIGTTPTPAVLKARILGTGVPLASTAGKTVTGRLVNAWRAIDVTGPVVSPINRYGINVGSVIGSSVSTTMTWPAATDDLSGVKSYLIKRSLNGGAFATFATGITARSYKSKLTFGTPTAFQLFSRDGAGNYGTGAIGPTVRAFLLQDGSTRARYSSGWSSLSVSGASNGHLHRSTRGGSTVTFTTTARAIGIVGRRGPLNGKAKVYVDGVYRSTINLRNSSVQSKVILFNTSWTSTAIHSVKLVVVGGTGRVEVDAFAFLR
jgi:subtilisin family serine protease